LDGLPLNKRQSELLNKRGIFPTSIISLRMSDIEVKKRVLSKPKEIEQIYDYYAEVVHNRLEANRKNLIEI